MCASSIAEDITHLGMKIYIGFLAKTKFYPNSVAKVPAVPPESLGDSPNLAVIL